MKHFFSRKNSIHCGHASPCCLCPSLWELYQSLAVSWLSLVCADRSIVSLDRSRVELLAVQSSTLASEIVFGTLKDLFQSRPFGRTLNFLPMPSYQQSMCMTLCALQAARPRYLVPCPPWSALSSFYAWKRKLYLKQERSAQERVLLFPIKFCIPHSAQVPWRESTNLFVSSESDPADHSCELHAFTLRPLSASHISDSLLKILVRWVGLIVTTCLSLTQK